MRKFINIVAVIVLSFVIFNISISQTDAQHLLSVVLSLVMFIVLIFNNERVKNNKVKQN